MATLSVAARQQVWRALMRWWSEEREQTPNFTKTDLYDSGADTGAIAEIDDWLDARLGNTAPDTVGLNGALSDPFKTNATNDQKSDALVFVQARRRSVDILKKLFREVD